LIQEQLNGIIRKLTTPLRDEDRLNEVLKARLTKREYKMMHAWSNKLTVSEIMSKLNLDEVSYEQFSHKLIKKLNQEKLKQELCI